jgi:hypothetical protein
MTTNIHAEPAAPIISNIRPSVAQPDPFTFWDDEVYAFLLAQGTRYRSTPIYTDAAALISHKWSEPIVAGRSMCVAPSVDGGYSKPSPNALIRDRWHDLIVKSTQTKSFTTGSPQGTLAVTALDRAIPAGFVIGHAGEDFLILVSDAAIGATSITVKKIYSDVTVSANDEYGANNGFFYQRGEGSPMVERMVLIGDPFPLINPGFEATRKYSCDGVAVSAMGGHYDKLRIESFPGHGLWVSSPTAFPTVTSRTMPWDKLELNLVDVSVSRCLSGITCNATDAMFGKLVTQGCRDYGVRFNGFAMEGDSIHSYGCNVGTSFPGGVYANVVQGESCNFGFETFNITEIGTLRVYSNTYRGFLSDAYNVFINNAFIQQDSGATNGDSYPTGWAAVNNGSRLMSPAFAVEANGCDGFLLGTSVHVMDQCRLAGRVEGNSASNKSGLKFACDFKGNVVDFNVNGFTNAVYFNNVAVVGNTMNFRGVTGNTVRWPDGTTGTFGTPNVPAGLSSTNQIAFHVY